MNTKCEQCKERNAECVHYKLWREKPLKGNHRLISKEHPELFENLCTLCHSLIHGNNPKKSELKHVVILRDRTIQLRNNIESQIKGFERIEFFVPEEWYEQKKSVYKRIKEYEKQIKKILDSGEYSLWDSWLKDVRGISYITASKFISHIDISKSETVSQLWRYCGLDATHIKRTKKISEKEAKKFGSPYLKKEILGILADSFIKKRTPIYREIYDTEKERQIQIKGISKKHAHRRAIRKMMKIFLAHYYDRDRRLNGLTVKEPYVKEILGHMNIIEPISTYIGHSL